LSSPLIQKKVASTKREATPDGDEKKVLTEINQQQHELNKHNPNKLFTKVNQNNKLTSTQINNIIKRQQKNNKPTLSSTPKKGHNTKEKPAYKQAKP